MTSPEPDAGWVNHDLALEFPELSLRSITLEAGPKPSPPELQAQLADLSTRYRGRNSLELKRQPVASAYRIFLRQVGIDPDVVRQPVETVDYDRMMRGRFASFNQLADALVATIVETQVALFAFDAERLAGPLGIRPAGEHDNTEPGNLVIADADQAISSLFGSVLADVEPSGRTRRVTVAGVTVAGVPAFTVDHALWRVADLLSST